MGLFDGFKKKKTEQSEEDKDKEIQSIYREIAEILGIPEYNRGMIDSPDEYYREHEDIFEERCIDADETDDIRWLGIIDEMIAADKIIEFDFKDELEDFIEELKDILPEGLTVDDISFDKDGYIPDWAAAINEHWEEDGYVLAVLDINSDSYVTYVCTMDAFEELAEKAKQVGHRVTYCQDL